MESNGMGSLDHMQRVINSFSTAVKGSCTSENFPLENTSTLARLMLFSVMVPVLSVQMTVALPNVSTVFICFTKIPVFISRHAPSAINVDRSKTDENR